MKCKILGLCLLLASCYQDKTKVAYRIHDVNGNDKLPLLFVSTPDGMKKVTPAVWNESSKKFSKGSEIKVILEPGDTVYSISQKYKIPIKVIIDLNNLEAPFNLIPGQVLDLGSPKIHIVQQNETLSSISSLHNTDTTSLVRINKLQHPYIIKIGDRLLLPSYIIPPQPKIIKPRIIKSKKKYPKIVYPNPKPRSYNTFLKPINGKIISYYGPKAGGSQNDGINIAAKVGDKVKAAENGIVIYSGNEIKSFGNMLLIKHSGNWVSTYGHLDSIYVKKGQHIKRGQSIGSVGQTGYVDKPQLHFELRKNSKPVNPGQYIR